MDLIEPAQLIRFFAALLFVIGLMGGLAVIMRKLNDRHSITAPNKRRLRIKESLALDARRRLLLIQRDDKEHLVILGANGETLIESGIESPHNPALDQVNDNDDKQPESSRTIQSGPQK